MSTSFCAHALEWWLRKQDKFTGAKVCTSETSEGSNEFEITLWEVEGVLKPSDTEIVKIIEEYEAAMIDKTEDKEAKRQSLLNKLGLTDEEGKELKELL